MRTLVIGGGYLGLRVAQRWRMAGHTVFVTSRKPARMETLASQGFEPILCDVLSPGPLPAVERLGYCVGLDRSTGVSMREVYVNGLGRVLNQLPGRPRFVQVSSTSVYGQRDGEAVDEAGDTNPADESGRIVLEAERLLRQYRPDAIVLRFAGIYGPGRLIREAALRAGEPIPSDPDKWLNLIHVEDGAGAVVAAAERAPEGATLNVADDRPVRRRSFYEALAKLLGAPPPRFIAPLAGAAHELANRQIRASRLRTELGVTLRYPDFESGLLASLSR